MRANYNATGNALVNPSNDDGNVGDEISSFAYMNTTVPKKEVDTKKLNEEKKSHSTGNFLEDVWNDVVSFEKVSLTVL